MERSSARLAPLDGVRGLAILIVVIHNTGWIAGSSEYLPLKIISAVSAAGWVGVQLFFVLSGFLITGILLDTKLKYGYFRSFYVRRILRIFPLYYAFLATTVFIAPHLAWSSAWIESVRQDHLPYWFYLQNWGEPFHVQITGLSHLWSLAVEEQFYLVWPLVVFGLSRRGLLNLTLVLLAVTPLIRLTLRLTGMPDYSAYMFTIARWDALAAGALIALLLRGKRGRRDLSRWQGTAAMIGVVGWLAVFRVERGFHSTDIVVQVVGQSVATVLGACLISYAVEEGPAARVWLQQALSVRWLRVLGKYSYAMYIFHQPIHVLLEPIFGEMVRGLDGNGRIVRLGLYQGTVLALTLVLAMGSWRLIEQPFLSLKDRIAPRPT